MDFGIAFWFIIFPACFVASTCLTVTFGKRLRRHTKLQRTGLLAIFFGCLPLGLDLIYSLAYWLLELGPAPLAKAVISTTQAVTVGIPLNLALSFYALTKWTLPWHSASIIFCNTIFGMLALLFFDVF
ncbi:hypothetical protein [Leisingera sp. M523]|uniref:hypothetical protein n=1 Tax=Leisingera sp. M523 TaxID=2867013 RepID=UPI0021A746F8|nr:hypothetical protein [Leisingera sp. M523]UWQ27372.1 hypothetical protein K3557_11125 [Leisingera sp. M523]